MGYLQIVSKMLNLGNETERFFYIENFNPQILKFSSEWRQIWSEVIGGCRYLKRETADIFRNLNGISWASICTYYYVCIILYY